MDYFASVLSGIISNGIWDSSKHIAGFAYRRVLNQAHVFKQGQQKDAELAFEKLLRKLKGEQDFLVSAADLSYVGPLLVRWWTRTGHIGLPAETSSPLQIRRVQIRLLGDELLRALVSMGALEKSFRDRLHGNLDAIVDAARKARPRIEVEASNWEKLPYFHGVICGDAMLYGPWLISTQGDLSSLESTAVFRRSANPGFFDECKTLIQTGHDVTVPLHARDALTAGSGEPATMKNEQAG